MAESAMSSHIKKFKQALPWVQLPLVSNAPMTGIATSKMAAAVSRSGGLGQIGFPGSIRALEEEMNSARQLLDGLVPRVADQPAMLPVSVGIIVVDNPVQLWLPVFSRHLPAVVWLSFGTVEQFSSWTSGIRQASPNTKVWIQVGSVATALETAKVCAPDALVLQGVDAGGHGHKNGASLMTLVPEVVDALEANGLQDVLLVAAGGIMDGRGAAAAMMLGAGGVVLGTRFLGAEEGMLEPDIRQEIFEVMDGGVSTARSRLWDDVWGPNKWPEMYDGRCLRNAMYERLRAGMSMNDIRKKLYEESQALQSQHTVNVKDVATIWAGTGVGMVKRIERAADIVKEVRGDMIRMLNETSQGLI